MCCIIPSINSYIPGLPNGKSAGKMCIHLDPITFKCAIWETETYPKFCRNFQAEVDVCGQTQEEAKELLTNLEYLTQPD
jgi:hypothetical protein